MNDGFEFEGNRGWYRRAGVGEPMLELTALRRPYIYFPLEDHFEQNLVVAKRLARHRAGNRIVYAQTPPEKLAEGLSANSGARRAGRPSPRTAPCGPQG